MTELRHALAVARLVRREQARSPRFRRTVAISVLGTLGVAGVLDVVTIVTRDRAERTERTVVAPADELDGLAEQLAGTHLVLELAADPAAVVAAGDADLAVVDGALHYDETREASLDALIRANAALSLVPQPERVRLDRDDRAVRHQLAHLLLLFGIGIGIVVAINLAEALTPGRAGSPAEGLLLTPLRRRTIAAGLALAPIPIVAVQYVTYLALGLALIIAVGGTAGLALGSVGIVAAAGAFQLTTSAAAISVLLAATVRNRSRSSVVATAASVLLSASPIVDVIVPGLTSDGPLALVPGLGIHLAVTDAMIGSAGAGAAAAIVATGVVVLVLSIALGTRLLGADGSGTRAA
jgi:hypothetical protein